MYFRASSPPYLGFLHLHDVGLTVGDAVINVINVGCQRIHFLVEREHGLLCLQTLSQQPVLLPDHLLLSLRQLLSLLCWKYQQRLFKSLYRTTSECDQCWNWWGRAEMKDIKWFSCLFLLFILFLNHNALSISSKGFSKLTNELISRLLICFKPIFYYTGLKTRTFLQNSHESVWPLKIAELWNRCVLSCHHVVGNNLLKTKFNIPSVFKHML